MSTLAPVIGAEWLKTRTVRSMWWFLLGAAAIMLLTAVMQHDDGDRTTVSALTPALGATYNLVQYLAAAFGILTITAEFASRSITVTFACTPSRGRVLGAKVLVVAASVLGSALALVGLSVVIVAVRLGEVGDLTGEHAAMVLRLGLYLALLAVIGLGVGALVRRTAGALSIVLFLLLLVPEILSLLGQRFGWSWLEGASDYTPAPAGYAFVDGDWAFGAVLLAWAVGLVALATGLLRRRDV